MKSIAPPTKSPPGSPMSEDRVPHATPSIASIFPPNYSGSGGSASDQTIPQHSNSISIIFPPTKSQTTESSESNQRFGQFSHSIPSIFPPTKSETDQSSESNQRFGQSSHSIPSVFPPTKSQTDQSSESNERLTQFSQHSIPSIFQPNMSDDTNSLDSMPKDMQNTEENKRNIKSIKDSIDVPEIKDLRWSRVVCSYKQDIERRLQWMIENHFPMNWTYGIFWKLSHDNSGVSILDWGYGYYQGDKDNLKAKKTSAMEQEHAKKMLVNLSLSNSGSVDEQELTDTERFLLPSKMLSFVNGSDLPGKAFTTSDPVWVVGVSSLASSPYDRARQGQHAGLQTMMFAPFSIGVVELGSTELLLEEKVLDFQQLIYIFVMFGK